MQRQAGEKNTLPMIDPSPNSWRDFRDKEAATFDDEPNHGLRDPIIRKAWTDGLVTWLAAPPGKLLDIGCGTGALSLVLASLGYDVLGVDWSSAMLDRAREKARVAGFPIDFQVMDAASPPLLPRQFDVLLCRHLLWSLPRPEEVLQKWADLLKPQGQMVLIEGYWRTGAGMHAQDIVRKLPSCLTNVVVEDLSAVAELWGREISDERYVIRTCLRR